MIPGRSCQDVCSAEARGKVKPREQAGKGENTTYDLQ